MSQDDWLSHLLKMVTISGRLDVRCGYGPPWRVASGLSAAHEIPYHAILKGRAVFEDLEAGTSMELVGGDIVLLPHGLAHMLHDGSGDIPRPTSNRKGTGGWTFSRNDAEGEQLDLLCGRLLIARPHEQLMRNLLPATLVVRTADGRAEADIESTSNRLAGIARLMRTESDIDKPGGHAILNALSAALFTLVVRAASKSGNAPPGLLALAADARLAPVISAMFTDPARPWSLSELADLCTMPRRAFALHFQETLGRSAIELLTDIRIGLAANALKNATAATEAVANSVGYRSVAAFRRAFTDRVGVTPGQWCDLARDGK
jgi:AraC family transcriptional activator of mtrCDE